MHSRSVKDKLHRDQVGQWVRLPDDIPGSVDAIKDELRGEFVAFYAPGTASNTYGIIEIDNVIQLPTGTPAVVESPVYVADIHEIGDTYSENDPVRAIRNVAVDTYDGDQVNWECNLDGQGGDTIAVVTVYHSTLSDGEAVDPQGANRYFDGTLNTSADIWIEALDTIGNSDVRCQLPADGKFLGLLSGTWDPDPEGSSDERPLYKIQPQHPGVVLGLVTASGTAADWSSTTVPVAGSCTVTLYNYTEAGALEVYKTGVTVAYMAETSPDAGSIVYCGMFEGYWHVITQLCAVASGYSE